MQNAGKLVVAGMLIVAIVLAGFAWWWNFHRGERSRAFWGNDAAMLIRQAPQVELLRLEPATEGANSDESIALGAARFAIVERKDISQAQGLLHARFALTEDASFEFDGSAPTVQPVWKYAAMFTSGQESATVLFDLDHSQVTLAETNRAARVIPKIVSGWRQFIGRHLTEPTANASPSEPQEPRTK